MTLSQSIIPAKTLVTPPPPPLFIATDGFSLQSKKFNNDSFFTQAFDPVINSNFSLHNFNPSSTTNNSMNSMEKGIYIVFFYLKKIYICIYKLYNY